MLKCENISKVYNDGWFSKKEPVKVLDGVSFHLKQGRSMGVLGKNGAGKSTLMRIILGLEKATKGNISFLGQNINNLKYKEMKNIYKNMQVVLQDVASAMNPRYSVYDIIKEPLDNYNKYSKNECRDIIMELLSAVALPKNVINKNITHLSGGEQQRVAIARALSIKPKLLVLDEALSNQDIITQSQIISLLEDLREKYSLSYLIISHDIRVILKLCQDIIFLEKGVIKDRLQIEDGISNISNELRELMSC